MLDLTQVFAWARMFGGYARSESVLEAARDTFDPAKPCALCRAVSRARDESNRQAPGPRPQGAEKILLVCENPTVFSLFRPRTGWLEAEALRPAATVAEVPVPPPRLPAA